MAEHETTGARGREQLTDWASDYKGGEIFTEIKSVFKIFRGSTAMQDLKKLIRIS